MVWMPRAGHVISGIRPLFRQLLELMPDVHPYFSRANVYKFVVQDKNLKT